MTLKRDYTEAFRVNEDEKTLKGLVKEATQINRISVKAMGIPVEALDVIQKVRNKLENDVSIGYGNDDGGGGLDVEAHPELADLGGDIPDDLVLPESAIAEIASQNPQLANKLRQKLAAKLGMSQYISENALKEEYRNKMRARAEPDQPRVRPKFTPRPY